MLKTILSLLCLYTISLSAQEKITSYNRDSTLSHYFTLQQKMLNGPFLVNTKHGDTLCTGHFKNNKPSGTWQVWDINGTLRTIRQFHPNGTCAILKQYHENGQLMLSQKALPISKPIPNYDYYHHDDYDTVHFIHGHQFFLSKHHTLNAPFFYGDQLLSALIEIGLKRGEAGFSAQLDNRKEQDINILKGIYGPGIYSVQNNNFIGFNISCAYVVLKNTAYPLLVYHSLSPVYQTSQHGISQYFEPYSVHFELLSDTLKHLPVTKTLNAAEEQNLSDLLMQEYCSKSYFKENQQITAQMEFWRFAYFIKKLTYCWYQNEFNPKHFHRNY